MSNESSVQHETVALDRESQLKQYCKTLTTDYNEAVEDIDNLEKTIQSLNSQLSTCRNALALEQSLQRATPDAVATQQMLLQRVADDMLEQNTLLCSVKDELERQNVVKKELDTVLDRTLSTVHEYSTMCSSTLGPAVERSHRVVKCFDAFLAQMTAVYAEKLCQISQIDLEISEKQALSRDCDEKQSIVLQAEDTLRQLQSQHADSLQLFLVEQENTKQQHSAEMNAATLDCDEKQSAILELQRQLQEQQKQMNVKIDQLSKLTEMQKGISVEEVELHKIAKQNEALKAKLQKDSDNIVAAHNDKLVAFAAEGISINEYGEEMQRSVIASISQYNQLQLKLSAISEDIKNASEIFLTEASKNEILEMDMTANTLMIVEMKYKLEQLTQKYSEMSAASAVCATEHEVLQKKNAVLDSRVADCSLVLADKTALIESMKTKFDNDTAEFSSLLHAQSLECARINSEHDTAQRELLERLEQRNEIESSIAWDTSVLDKLKEKKLQIKSDMTKMRHEQHEMLDKSHTLEADIQQQTLCLQEVLGTIDAKQCELVKRTHEHENMKLVLVQLSDNETQMRARVVATQHELESEEVLLSRKQHLSDEINRVSCELEQAVADLTQQKLLVQRAFDEAMQLEQQKTITLENITNSEKHLAQLEESVERFRALGSETDTLSTKCRELQDHIETLSYTHQNILDKIKHSSERLSCLHAELDESYAKQSDVENTILMHNQNMVKYVNEQAACEEISTHLENKQAEMVALSLRKNSLKIEMQQIQDTKQMYAGEIDNLHKQVQTLSLQLETQACAAVEVESRLQQKNADILLLDAEIASSNQKLQQSIHGHEELAQITVRLDEMVEHVATLHRQYEERQRAIDAQQIQLDQLTAEHAACQGQKNALDTEMSAILLLIQEQQEKRQHISQEIGEISNDMDRLLDLKNNMKLEHAEMQTNHEQKMQHAQILGDTLQQHESVIRERIEISEKLEMDLKSRNDAGAQRSLALVEEHETICAEIEAKKLLFSTYQDKLKHVNVYAEHIGIALNRIESLWSCDPDTHACSSNTLVLGQVVTLFGDFMDWFESTFLFQLSLLSSAMTTSQLMA